MYILRSKQTTLLATIKPSTLSNRHCPPAQKAHESPNSSERRGYSHKRGIVWPLYSKESTADAMHWAVQSVDDDGARTRAGQSSIAKPKAQETYSLRSKSGAAAESMTRVTQRWDPSGDDESTPSKCNQNNAKLFPSSRH